MQVLVINANVTLACELVRQLINNAIQVRAAVVTYSRGQGELPPKPLPQNEGPVSNINTPQYAPQDITPYKTNATPHNATLDRP